MPLSATCRNCGQSKSSDTYWDDYCVDCQNAKNQAREYARQNDLDPGSCAREALAQRAHNIHNNRPHPRRPMTKHDYWNATHPTGSAPAEGTDHA